MYDYSKMTVLVTGASRGIGAELAREVALRGAAHLVLVARAEDELQQLADELRAKFPVQATVLLLDLTQEGAAHQVKAATDRQNITVDILVNNAGIGSSGFFDETAAETLDKMIALNITALVALTRLYLPDMVKRNRGGVLNVSSTAAFQPVAYTATYAATKAFVQSFTEAIWAENEERGTDLHITAVCPGATESHFSDNLGDRQRNFDKRYHMSAIEVAKLGWAGWERGGPYIVTGVANYVGTFGARILPRGTMARFTTTLFRPSDFTPKQRREISPQAIALGVVAVGAVALGSQLLRKK